MSRGRLRAGVMLCWVLCSGCQGPDKVYFEQAGGSAGGGAPEPIPSTGGASSSGGSGGAAGGTSPTAGGAPETGTAAASGDAGSTSSGGAPAAASGGQTSAGGVSVPPVMVDAARQAAACADYVIAQCHVLSECEGARYDQCLKSSLGYCPERFFSPGSRYSVEGVERCSEQWQQLGCEDLSAGRYPECGIAPGERKVGEACRFGSQCETGRCAHATVDSCGRCVPVAGRGEACGEDVALCDDGLACLETGVCGERAAQTALGLGDACGTAIGCEPGLRCAADTAGARTCQAKIALGEACGATSECLDGFCDDVTKICLVVPGLGMPCALEGRHPERSCAGGSVCDAHVDPPVCVTAVGRGQPCWVNPKQADGSTCEPGLSCQCTDTTCATRQCQQLVGPGEDCSFAAFCVEGSECRGGRCGPQPAQPGDTEACGS